MPSRSSGGVPQSVLYDNDRCLVARILPDGTRKRATLFSGFLSHYLIRDRYGRPGKGNDKGAVEGLVGWARRNFMVPLPRFASWEDFNAWLEEQCRKRQAEILRGHTETIGARLARDLAAMADLPAAPFDACDQATGRVSSQALVRYKTNDYSVPVAYGHRDVWVRGYVDEVVIGCGGEIVARHPRCYDREDMVFDPVHYLPLIEKKIGALDQAAPLAEWDLPRRVPDPAPADGGADDQGGPPGIRAGSAAAGDLRDRRPACRGEDRAAHGRRRLRRRQAPGAVPGREAPAEARPRRLPLSAARHRRPDLGGQLHVPGRRGMRHDRRPRDPARPSPQDAEAADLLAGIREARPPVRRRGAGPRPLPRPAGGAGADRPRAPDDRAPDQGRTGSRRSKASTASTSRRSPA